MASKPDRTESSAAKTAPHGGIIQPSWTTRAEEVEPGYPVYLTKGEARLILGALTAQELQRIKDYEAVVVPLLHKLRAVL